MKESSRLFWERKLGTPDSQIKEWEDAINHFENLDRESDGYESDGYEVSDLVTDSIIRYLEVARGVKIIFDKRVIMNEPGITRYSYNGKKDPIFHRDGYGK